jgi:hypothetical protein
MGVQVLPNLQDRPARSGLHLVAAQPAVAERLSLELPHYASNELSEDRDPLGCVRGVAIALGLQGAVMLLAFGLWKLHIFLR